MHHLVGSIKLYAVDEEELFEWSTVQQSPFTAPTLPLVFATLGDEVYHPLQTKQPTEATTEVPELDADGNVVRAGTPFVVERCPESRPFLIQREGKSQDPDFNELDSK